MRVFYTKYTATGLETYTKTGAAVAEYVSTHLWQTKTILFATVVLETGAFVMLLHKRIAPLYGLLLLAMHAGIYCVMDITFPSIMVPMLAVAVNPLYWLLRLFFVNSNILK